MDEDVLARPIDSQNRDRVLGEFNRSTLDDVGPMGGGEQGIKVLQGMNSLVDDHEAFVKSLAPSVHSR